MASSKKKKVLAIGALVALLLFAGNANAKDGGIEVKPPQDEGYGDNWGVFPDLLKGPFLAAEKAAKLPGLARFMAIWSWGAFRAKKAFVSPLEAAAIAFSNPLLCSSCQNLDDGVWSRQALERVTKTIEEGGAYDPPWPSPDDYDGWADFGSAGLFDLLSGSVLHLGIHEQFDNGFTQESPDLLFELGPQLYLAGVFIHRVFNNPNYLVLQESPADTWMRVRAVTSSPKQYLAWQNGDEENVIATTAMDNFLGRAAELGIDLSKLANPSLSDVKNWPGASTYFDAVIGLTA